MFKFDFDIEDAEDLDVLHPKPTATKAQGEEPIDATLVLEPFSEVPIKQLVRAILSTSNETGPDAISAAK